MTSSFSDEDGGASGGSTPMHRTIGIAVGCAGVYILLVIGLMIYCRARRARLLKGMIKLLLLPFQYFDLEFSSHLASMTS